MVIFHRFLYVYQRVFCCSHRTTEPFFSAQKSIHSMVMLDSPIKLTGKRFAIKNHINGYFYGRHWMGTSSITGGFSIVIFIAVKVSVWEKITAAGSLLISELLSFLQLGNPNGSVSKPGTPSEHQNSWDLWMFIPLKMVLIGIDPYPNLYDSMAKIEWSLGKKKPISWMVEA